MKKSALILIAIFISMYSFSNEYYFSSEKGADNNDKSLGIKSMSTEPGRIFRWAVPFEAGTLTAKAGFDGAIITSELVTTSEAVGITLSADKTTLKADGYDVSHVVVQLVDKEGRPTETQNTKVSFELEGDVRMLCVDNGNAASTQDFQSNSVYTSKGRCLLLIQSNRNSGKVIVKAIPEGYEEQTISIEIKQ